MAGLKRYLKRDGLLVVTSLVLAVLVWAYVDDELTETRTVAVRLEVKIPENLELISKPPSTVRVALRGPRGRMAALDVKSVLARYELPAGAQGDVPVKLTEEDFLRLPEGVKVAVLPESFSIKTAPRLAKRVKVTVYPIKDSKPAEGYAVLESPRAVPGEVMVRGRKEKIENLSVVYTEKVDISGRREWRPAYFNVVTEEGVICNERVLVLMKIGKAPVPRDVPNVAVKLLIPPGFTLRVKLVSTSTITVRLYGNPEQVTAVDPRSILAVVDVSSLVEAEKGKAHPLAITVKPPAGLSLAPGATVPKALVQVLK
jgi:hypothetical protein